LTLNSMNMLPLLPFHHLQAKKGNYGLFLNNVPLGNFLRNFSKNHNWETHGGELTPYKSILLQDQSVIVDPTEYKKFENILQKLGGSKDRITKVYAIQNDALESAFLFYYMSLQEKFRSSPNLFKKNDWKRDVIPLREWTYTKFTNLCNKFDADASVPVIPVLHGTGKDTAWKIVQTGFTTVATVDDGFYGRGIYFTSSFDYSTFYSRNANKGTKKVFIIVALLLPGNPYPVIESPISPKSLKGKGPIDPSGYQSHYVCVNPFGVNPVGFPCAEKLDKCFDELVVFQDYQALPRYIIEMDVEY